jgi:hypothetical protein
MLSAVAKSTLEIKMRVNRINDLVHDKDLKKKMDSFRAECDNFFILVFQQLDGLCHLQIDSNSTVEQKGRINDYYSGMRALAQLIMHIEDKDQDDNKCSTHEVLIEQAIYDKFELMCNSALACPKKGADNQKQLCSALHELLMYKTNNVNNMPWTSAQSSVNHPIYP